MSRTKMYTDPRSVIPLRMDLEIRKDVLVAMYKMNILRVQDGKNPLSLNDFIILAVKEFAKTVHI